MSLLSLFIDDITIVVILALPPVRAHMSESLKKRTIHTESYLSIALLLRLHRLGLLQWFVFVVVVLEDESDNRQYDARQNDDEDT